MILVRYLTIYEGIYMGISKNRGSILIGFSIIDHPFWGTIIFGNTHIFRDFQQTTLLQPSIVGRRKPLATEKKRDHGCRDLNFPSGGSFFFLGGFYHVVSHSHSASG